jgi:hypothetical protein
MDNSTTVKLGLGSARSAEPRHGEQAAYRIGTQRRDGHAAAE